MAKKKRGFRSLLLKLALAAVAVYLVAGFVGGQVQLAAKQRELAALSAQVAAQIQENRELARMMEEDNTDAYIERMAREKLGYVKPNERIFVDLTGE
jgi:cell division protein FtsB